jgi:hypothetical protein
MKQFNGETTSGARNRRKGSAWALYTLIVLAIAAIAYTVVDRMLFSREATFAGEWSIDTETAEWLGRTCAYMEFEDDTNRRLEITRSNDDVVVLFNNRMATSFVGRQSGGRVSARQMIAATETGRFCGDPLLVQMQMSIRTIEPDILRVRWSLPNCDVCPDQRFTAQRVSDT